MVNSEVKKAWEASFRQGNGLCDDVVRKSGMIDRRNRMNYNLPLPEELCV